MLSPGVFKYKQQPRVHQEKKNYHDLQLAKFSARRPHPGHNCDCIASRSDVGSARKKKISSGLLGPTRRMDVRARYFYRTKGNLLELMATGNLGSAIGFKA